MFLTWIFIFCDHYSRFNEEDSLSASLSRSQSLLFFLAQFVNIHQSMKSVTSSINWTRSCRSRAINNSSCLVSRIEVLSACKFESFSLFSLSLSQQWFEDKTIFIENLDVQLRKLHSSLDFMVTQRRELAANSGVFARSAAMLGNCEEHTGLSRWARYFLIQRMEHTLAIVCI